MKPLAFSRHARRRMRLYDVSPQQVSEVIDSPDVVEASIKVRMNATKTLGGRKLRITFLEEDHRYVIITVTPLDDPKEIP